MRDLVTISFMVPLLWFHIESLSLMSAICLVIVNIMPAEVRGFGEKVFQ
jgi:hypothetical protein